MVNFWFILDDTNDLLCSSLFSLSFPPFCFPAPIRKIRIGGSRLLQIKGARSFRVKKGGSLSSIRRAGSLKSTKLSRQDSESENEEGLLSQTQSRDTVTDIGNVKKNNKRLFQILGRELSVSFQVFHVAGSPFSASEPSIEPEGPSSGGTEDNYHRNMSWLHVGPSVHPKATDAVFSSLTSLFSTDHDPSDQPAELHLHAHWLLPPPLLPTPWALLRSSGPCHQAGVRRKCGQSERGQLLLWNHWRPTKEKQRGQFSNHLVSFEVKELNELKLFANVLFQCSDKSCLRTPSMKRRPTDSNTEGKKDTGMLKYIRNQVSVLSQLHRYSLSAGEKWADLYRPLKGACRKYKTSTQLYDFSFFQPCVLLKDPVSAVPMIRTWSLHAAWLLESWKSENQSTVFVSIVWVFWGYLCIPEYPVRAEFACNQ